MKLVQKLVCGSLLALASAGAMADYTNPVLHADYSDPDAIRVGNKYYMVASSFNEAPGLPLLESDDMVHWKLVGHAIAQNLPLDMFAKPQHGKGVWAPCIRFHDGKFWIFYPDPDQGVFVTTATSFAGPWSEAKLILAGKGIIDPTPLWDDDGKAYLLHGWAKSRAGINNQLSLRNMKPDASGMLDTDSKVIIDGNKLAGYTTLEGPKFHKHNGYYYVFAPAGGVEHGWQSVFRSRKIDGPYEDKIVMAQGNSPTNGPHQGAWVDTPDGKDWFYHFQHKGAYGRIVHLQPMAWKNDWPVIGEDKDGDGVGQPVLKYASPVAGKFAAVMPATSDDFSGKKLGLQWQWNANWHPEWYSLTARPGFLRLNSQFESDAPNQWNRSSILLQKLTAPVFTVTTRIDTKGQAEGDNFGLIMYGYDSKWLGVRRVEGKPKLVLVSCFKALKGCEEKTEVTADLPQSAITMRMSVTDGGKTQFAYSLDNKKFTDVGEPLVASVGHWVGARIGIFSAASQAGKGYVDVDDFSVK
ncbi:MAG: glycoside hydrolase 43 family protein [Massilia sp.]